jgi:hypothetical protein
MAGAYFYIEYQNGAVTQNEFRTPSMARKAFKLYAKEPELNAKSWGWDTKYETPTLAQQIRTKKAA